MRCSRPFTRLGGPLFATSLAATFLLLVSTRSVWGQAAQNQVTGTVTSAVDSSLLPAVRVSVRGTTTEPLTATNGRYTITVPTPRHPVVVTLIGRRGHP